MEIVVLYPLSMEVPHLEYIKRDSYILAVLHSFLFSRKLALIEQTNDEKYSNHDYYILFLYFKDYIVQCDLRELGLST